MSFEENPPRAGWNRHWALLQNTGAPRKKCFVWYRLQKLPGRGGIASYAEEDTADAIWRAEYAVP